MKDETPEPERLPCEAFKARKRLRERQRRNRNRERERIRRRILYRERKDKEARAKYTNHVREAIAENRVDPPPPDEPERFLRGIGTVAAEFDSHPLDEPCVVCNRPIARASADVTKCHWCANGLQRGGKTRFQ